MDLYTYIIHVIRFESSIHSTSKLKSVFFYNYRNEMSSTIIYERMNLSMIQVAKHAVYSIFTRNRCL